MIWLFDSLVATNFTQIAVIKEFFIDFKIIVNNNVELHSNSIKNKEKKKKIANMMLAKMVTENTKREKAKSKPQGWTIVHLWNKIPWSNAIIRH